MNNFLFSLKRAPARARDAAFALTCRVLLPIATDCKVCNMLRGVTIGMPLGAGALCLVLALLRYLGWVA